jgi:hypothetical protein
LERLRNFQRIDRISVDLLVELNLALVLLLLAKENIKESKGMRGQLKLWLQ